jgi:CheY-like chemotaxis protein
MTILNIDDDPDDLEVFCDAVGEIDPNIKCISAQKAEEGLQILFQAKTLPDYVFLDVNMPVMDGKKCLQEIRSNPKLSNIRVIMLSTSSNAGEITEYKKLGAEFIVKEATYSRFVKSLKNIIKR